MIELQQNRYLWVHFAGLAFVPLLLDICLAGLASAGPALPFGGQFWAIALLCITPALVMQWLKPFYVFSLPPSALKPAVLSEDQRRCLQIFKSWQIKALAIVVAVFSLWLLVKMYAMSVRISPLLTPKAGLMSAAIAFFTASSFMQISVSAGRALLIGPSALKRVSAVEESAIARDFLILGFRVKKLLPDSLSNADETPREDETPLEKAAVRQRRNPAAGVTDDELKIVKEQNVEKSEIDKAFLSKNEETLKEEKKIEEDTTTEEKTALEQDERALNVESSQPNQSAVEEEDPEVIIPETLPPESEEIG